VKTFGDEKRTLRGGSRGPGKKKRRVKILTKGRRKKKNRGETGNTKTERANKLETYGGGELPCGESEQAEDNWNSSDLAPFGTDTTGKKNDRKKKLP